MAEGGRYVDQHASELRTLARGEALDRGRGWLLNTRRTTEGATGWPHTSSQIQPAVWGGTLDGIIGLSRTGVSRYDPAVSESLKWLLSQQRTDGGFGSREMTYSATEPTAWVLIALRMLNIDPLKTPEGPGAVEFLETCIGDDGSVGTSPGEEPRVYPALLTLWALPPGSPKSKLVYLWLLEAQDSTRGGWGSKNDTPCIPSRTAQVLCAIFNSRQVEPQESFVLRAVDFLLQSRNENGSWDNHSETWISKHQPHIPLTLNDHTISWALRALLMAGMPVLSDSVVVPVSALVAAQARDGSWQYDPYEPELHVWCVAGAIWTLADARDRLQGELTDRALGPLVREGGAIVISTARIRAAASAFAVKVRANFLYVLVAGLVLFVTRDWVAGLISWTLGGMRAFLAEKGLDILADLAAAMIWFVLGALIAAGLRWVEAAKPRGQVRFKEEGERQRRRR